MIRGLHHCAIASTDVDKLAKFYCDMFGFAKITEGSWDRGNAELDAIVGLRDSASRFVMLGTKNCFLELFEYSSPEVSPGDPNRRACDPGITHLCMYVSDIESEYNRLVAGGMRFHAPPLSSNVIRVTYGRDPDGNIIELMEVIESGHPYQFHALDEESAPA